MVCSLRLFSAGFCEGRVIEIKNRTKLSKLQRPLPGYDVIQFQTYLQLTNTNEGGDTMLTAVGELMEVVNCDSEEPPVTGSTNATLQSALANSDAVSSVLSPHFRQSSVLIVATRSAVASEPSRTPLHPTRSRFQAAFCP